MAWAEDGRGKMQGAQALAVPWAADPASAVAVSPLLLCLLRPHVPGLLGLLGDFRGLRESSS